MIRPATSYDHLLTLLPDDKHTSMWVHTQAGQLPEEMIRDGQQLYVAHYNDDGAEPQKTWAPVIRANSPSIAVDPQRQAHTASEFPIPKASSNKSAPALDINALWPQSLEDFPVQGAMAVAPSQEFRENLLRMQQPLDSFPLLPADAGLNFMSQVEQYMPLPERHDETLSPRPHLDMSLLWSSHSAAVSQPRDVTSSDSMFAYLNMATPESLIDISILWPIVDDTPPYGHNASIKPNDPPAVTMLTPQTTPAIAFDDIAPKHTLNRKGHGQLHPPTPANSKPTSMLSSSSETDAIHRAGPKVTQIAWADVYVHRSTGAIVDHKSKGAILRSEWEKQPPVGNTFLPRQITSKKEMRAIRQLGAQAGAPAGITKASRPNKRIDLKTGRPTTATGPGTRASTTHYSQRMVDPETGLTADATTQNPTTYRNYQDMRPFNPYTGEETVRGAKDSVTYRYYYDHAPVDPSSGKRFPWGTAGTVSKQEYRRLQTAKNPK
jgi:hypothetical protein